MPREFLFATKEAVPGVFDTAAITADKFVVRTDRQSFNALDVPVQWRIRDAAGSNRVIQTGNEQATADGSLSTILYPTQAPMLVKWGATIASDPPEPPFTITFDHMRMMEDSANTVEIRRYLGCKCKDFTLNANNSGDGVVCRTDYTFAHMGESVISSTDRPTPALSTYPSIKPYVFQDLSGGLILRTSGSAVRTHFASVSIKVANIIYKFYDENRYPDRLSWRGRDVSADIKFRLEDLDDRDAMIAATANTMEILFDAGVTPNRYTLNFDFHDEVRIMSDQEDRPLDGGFYHTVGALGMIDLTDGTDLTVTTTGPL